MSGHITKQLQSVRQELPSGVNLVAVSKFHPVEDIEEAYRAGQRIFGESHEQELSKKVKLLPQDIEWHFIGHLQTNKVKYIVPYISLIHSVDSLKLLKEIDKQAAKCNRVVDVLLQLHLAEETTKYGFTPEACTELLASGVWKDLLHVRICGVMMMASNTDNTDQIAAEMQQAANYFETVRQTYFADAPHFCFRSWGMSDDYLIAIKHGSNMIRIGSHIFGARVY